VELVAGVAEWRKCQLRHNCGVSVHLTRGHIAANSPPSSHPARLPLLSLSLRVRLSLSLSLSLVAEGRPQLLVRRRFAKYLKLGARSIKLGSRDGHSAPLGRVARDEASSG